MSKKLIPSILQQKRQAKIDGVFIVSIAGLMTMGMYRSGHFVEFPMTASYFLPLMTLWGGVTTFNESPEEDSPNSKKD